MQACRAVDLAVATSAASFKAVAQNLTRSSTRNAFHAITG